VWKDKKEGSMGQETPQFTFTSTEKQQLLDIARRAITAAASRKPIPEVDLDTLPQSLLQSAACFVTLHVDDMLRGCTGSLVAQRPLAQEVSLTAVQTAFRDPRFPPVSAAEVPNLDIEISVLTPPRPLTYTSPEDLIVRLRPGVDGVTLRQGFRRATFLPQVWERIPEPRRFLEMLCQKMGLPADAWLSGEMEVEVYQAIAWSEAEIAS
jgi:AmmeMemoRadiSam system protein A